MTEPTPTPDPTTAQAGEPRPCTCHPDDSPPFPCPHRHALSECRKVEQIAEIISPSAFYRKRKGRLQGDVYPADREANRERAFGKAAAIIALFSGEGNPDAREARQGVAPSVPPPSPEAPKPCPFCGCALIRDAQGLPWGHPMEEMACLYRQEAITADMIPAWNRRALSRPLKAEVEAAVHEAREAIEDAKADRTTCAAIEIGFVEDLIAAAQSDALRAARVEELDWALAQYDRYSATCPIKGPLAYRPTDKCPSCGALAEDNCGKEATASYHLIQALRLVLAKGEPR